MDRTQPQDQSQMREPLGADHAPDSFADAARRATSDYLNSRKSDLANAVGEFATSLRSATAGVSDRPNVQPIIASACEGIDSLADRIRSRDVGDIADDVTGFLKRRPAAVAVVALGLGFLAFRAFYASGAATRYRSTEPPAPGPHTARRDTPVPAPVTGVEPASAPMGIDPDLGVPPRY